MAASEAGQNRGQYLSVGLIALVAFGIIIILYYVIDMSNDQDAFIEKWDKRIQFANKINNLTQDELLELNNNTTFILKEINNKEANIIGNLTDHRLVTNYTRDDILLPLLNRSLTTEQSVILADKAVKDIVGNITQAFNNTDGLNNNND